MSRFLINNSHDEALFTPVDQLPVMGIKILKSVKAKTKQNCVEGMSMKGFLVESGMVVILNDNKFLSLKRDEYRLL